MKIDIRTKAALEKIQLEPGATVSFTEFIDSQLSITCSEAIDKFGRSLPGPIWLYSPNSKVLEHSSILMKILKIVESECQFEE